MSTSKQFAFVLAISVLAGCGRVGLDAPVAQTMSSNGVTSKAVLMQRLVVGFSKAPTAAELANLEKTTGVKVVRQMPKLALAVVEASGDVKAARTALRSVAGVAFVENELLPELNLPTGRPLPTLPRQGASGVDPMRKDQWGLDKMNVPKVWEAAGSLATVTVGLVDTGVDDRHPDLQGALVPGYNAAKPGAPTTDDAGHGTMTAGCIAAIANNGLGVAGVAPNAKVMPIKVGNTASSVVDAMTYAADHCDMISMSLSFKPGMSEYETAVQTTRRAAEYVMSKSVPMVCSMGNTGSWSKNVPSGFAGKEVPGLIAVGASDKDDHVADFSTVGDWVSVAAPGVKIVTTAKGGGYNSVDGTSFATPLTAGVVALMLGHGAKKDPAAIKKTLQATAVDIDSPGNDNNSGAGRVDAYRAVMGTSR